MRTEDGCIIQDCLNGKPEAFGILVDKYKEGIYAFVYAQVRDFHDAQDVTQEVFLQAYRDLRSLRRWESFCFWIYRIAYRCCAQYFRARSKRVDRQFIDDKGPSLIDSTSLDQYHVEEMNESVREALDSLPESYKEVLFLHYLGGMTSREIAEALGISPMAVLTRLSRARAKLREDMITMIDTDFEGQRLPAGFTFRIVEIIKRIRIQPLPDSTGVPWGLSIAIGIILMILSLGSYLNISSFFEVPPDSDTLRESHITEVSELPINLMKISQFSGYQGNADAGNSGLSFQQNAVLMAPEGEGGKIPDEPSTQIGKGELHDIAYSPDGKIFAVSTGSGVRLYDANKLNETGILKGDKLYTKITFSSDSKILATGNGYGGAYLWDLQTQKQIGSITDGQGDFEAFSPDNKILVMSDLWGGNNNLQLWDAQKLERIGLMRGHTDTILYVAFTPDGKILASTSYDKTIRLWDVQEQRQIGTLNGNKSLAIAVAISPDGKTMASGGGEENKGELLLWNIQERKLMGFLEGHKDPVVSVVFSPDGKTLFSSDYQDIRIWDVQEQRQIALLKTNKRMYLSLSLNPDGKTLASMSYGSQEILFWNVQEQKQTDIMDGFTGTAFIAFSPDGKILASGGNQIIFWNVADQKKIGQCIPLDFGIDEVAFSPDGKILAGYSWDRIIYLIDVNKQKLMGSLKGHTDNIRSIAFSPDGKLLASGSLDMTLRLWDVQEQKEVWKQNCPSHTHAVAFTPDGESIIVGIGGNGPILIYNVKTKKQTDILQTPGYVVNLAVSPDGELLASQVGSNTIIFWDLIKKRQLGIAGLGNDVWISSLMFSPDGKWLALSSDGGTSFIWDVNTRGELAKLKVRIISFSPDGKWFATAGDGTIQLWEVNIPVQWKKAVETTGKLPWTWGEMKKTTLLQNYPNPFNPETWIPYSLGEDTDVNINIYSSSGNLIRTLNLGNKPQGIYLSKNKAAYWDGRNEDGESVASGIYFYVMEAGEYKETRKMVIMR